MLPVVMRTRKTYAVISFTGLTSSPFESCVGSKEKFIRPLACSREREARWYKLFSPRPDFSYSSGASSFL